MANRLDYYFRQKVTEAELDEGFAKMEQGQLDIMADQQLIGVFSGGVVSENSPTPDLTVDVSGPCVGRDKDGNRLFFSPLQNLDMSVDENGVSTSVGTPGNEKTLAIFLAFDRALSDPRLDGNAVTVFFQRAESFKLNVVQSAEAAIASSTPPALRVDEILLADVVIVNAQTQIFNGDIDTSRREDVFDLTGSPNSIKTGRVNDALQDMLDILNAVVNGGASTIGYAGGANWADATTNPATNVEAQLDKIIDDLGTGTGGTAKLSGAASANPNPVLTATTLAAQLTELESQIVDGASKHGDIVIGVPLPRDDKYKIGATWTFIANTGDPGYWDYTAAAAAEDLQIPLPLKEGDTLKAVNLTYETAAATNDLDIAVAKYDQQAAAIVRSVVGSVVAGGGTLGNFFSATISGLTHVVDNGNDRYQVEVQPSDAGGGARRIHACEMVINRAAA